MFPHCFTDIVRRALFGVISPPQPSRLGGADASNSHCCIFGEPFRIRGMQTGFFIISGCSRSIASTTRFVPMYAMRFSLHSVLAVAMLILPGCATIPYSFGTAQSYYSSPELAARGGTQIERGRPNVVLDTFGWVWGIPGKIILFDRRVENHRIDSLTEAEIEAYLNDNELSTVKVRLNQYRPMDDWQRLGANKSVGAGWRYTLGAISVLGETVFPGRLFGSDHYNPFTNTIHVYSNVPALALHEAGHSKDFARRKWKGTYAAVYLVPAVPLYHEAIATNDTLGYVVTTRDHGSQQEAYEILYPAYGTYVGDALSGVVPFGYLAGVIGGHIAGQWKSRTLPQSTESDRDPMLPGRSSEVNAGVRTGDLDDGPDPKG